MQQQVFLAVITLIILLIQHCHSHSEQQPKGFPKQFVAILNQTSYLHQKDSGAPEQLVYDFINQRARFDIKGWRAKQNETYMIQFKPNGAEHESISNIRRTENNEASTHHVCRSRACHSSMP
ncbi:unnamed protein product [Rotaria sordida]|uniref:Secreted protein n=1 Tax=Rotaria sordida TaxID=392033 RepID=A0A813TZC0_9BILA|nr:unnamed protein product [Rotaria sordida]